MNRQAAIIILGIAIIRVGKVLSSKYPILYLLWYLKFAKLKIIGIDIEKLKIVDEIPIMSEFIKESHKPLCDKLLKKLALQPSIITARIGRKINKPKISLVKK